MRIETLVKRFDLKVAWTQFPLHPDTPTEGRSLADLFAGRGYDLENMKAQMKQRMANEGLPYGDRAMTYNSRLAQELAKWADDQQGGETIHDALFKAYFVAGENIGHIDVLLPIVDRLGLDVATAHQVLTTRSYSDAVDRDWQRSRDLAVTGVPTFVIGKSGVVGAQPFDVLENFVISAGALPRTVTPADI